MPSQSLFPRAARQRGGGVPETMPMGRPRKGEDEIRRPRDIWISDDEWSDIKSRAAAARLPIRQYVRQAALGRAIKPMPSVENIDAWQQLARTTANLNQLTHYAHQSGDIDLVELSSVLATLRDDVESLRGLLIGVDNDDDDDDDEDAAP